MLNDLAYGNPGILDGERPSEGHARTLPSGTSRERQNWNVAGVRIGDYEISSGRLLHHDYHPFRGTRTVDVGPALYVWPGDDGVWCESARGGFGLPGVREMFRDAWTGATSTVIRRYGPEHGKVKRVLDYVWQTCFHRTAVTPFGAVEAGSPEAMKALEACAVRRGCQNEQR